MSSNITSGAAAFRAFKDFIVEMSGDLVGEGQPGFQIDQCAYQLDPGSAVAC